MDYTSEPLKTRVWTDLDCALESGYGPEILTWSPEEIANDLLAYSSSYSNDEMYPETLLPHVKSWLEENS